jgi:uncharacterized protein YbbC (DUF1343 family)
MRWPDTGLPWVTPSPNIPQVETVFHYPGSCLIEGTQLSEGRGTGLPFEIVGAPWIDGFALADHLNKQGWHGVRFRPHTFLPSTSKWAGQDCYGIQAHIMDGAAYQPIRVWLGIVREIRALYPERALWLAPNTTGVEPGRAYHFDRLIGSQNTRRLIDAGATLDELTAGWDETCQAFEAERQEFLLYD